jgi:hypothetical protein
LASNTAILLHTVLSAEQKEPVKQKECMTVLFHAKTDFDVKKFLHTVCFKNGKLGEIK